MLAFALALIIVPGFGFASASVDDPQEGIAFTSADWIDPEGIPGALVIVGGGEMPPEIRRTFVDLAGGAKARIVVIPTASQAAETDPEASWTEGWTKLDPAPESVRVLHTRDRQRADDPAFVEPLRQATAVWFSGGDQNRIAQAYLDTAVEREIHAVLKRGGVVGGTSAGAAIQTRVMIGGGNPIPEIVRGFDLLPDAITDQHFLKRHRQSRLERAVADHPGRFGVGIDEATALVVRGRSLNVVGRSSVTIVLGAGAETTTTTRKDQMARHDTVELEPPTPPFDRAVRVFTLQPGESADLTALRRAARDRARPPVVFGTPRLESGSLLIVGGGRVTPDMARVFVEKAGGPDALIICLQTALPDPLPNRSPDEAFFRRAGARRVVTLNQRTPEELNTTEVRDALSQAGGVWFGGGRQWRFVDAYEGTPVVGWFHDVLKRGGVIGGSSAGASIQAEFLVRGHPLGNEEMMAEGYQRGFGFLPGVAIDQHFAQRNRFADLRAVVRRHPGLLGIGIDESTAILVEGSTARVLGEGSVHLDFRPDNPAPEPDRSVPAGESFDLTQPHVHVNSVDLP